MVRVKGVITNIAHAHKHIVNGLYFGYSATCERNYFGLASGSDYKV